MSNRRRRVDLSSLNELIRVGTQPLLQPIAQDCSSTPRDALNSREFREDSGASIPNTYSINHSGNLSENYTPRYVGASYLSNQRPSRVDMTTLNEQIRTAIQPVVQADIDNNTQPQCSASPHESQASAPPLEDETDLIHEEDSGASFSDGSINRPANLSENYIPRYVGANYLLNRRPRRIDMTTLNERIRCGGGISNTPLSSADLVPQTQSTSPLQSDAMYLRQTHSTVPSQTSEATQRTNFRNRRPDVVNLNERIRVAVADVPRDNIRNINSVTQPTAPIINNGTSQPFTDTEIPDTAPPSYEQVIANLEAENHPPAYHELSETDKIQPKSNTVL